MERPVENNTAIRFNEKKNTSQLIDFTRDYKN